jgi:LuxR family maltose regulon positive regulatory protein
MPPVPVGSTRVPQLPDPFVRRARLLTVLDDERCRTTLVCAPAGFGKTALLAHWARAAATATPVAWANLSSATGNLWDAVLPALLSCSAVPEDSLLHELTRSAPASPTTSFTNDVLAALDTLPKQVALVLHDIHEIVAPTALAALEALVTARPAGVRLILCSRWDTPSPLGGMRSAGHLNEIRADRLRFSPDETREMLRLSKLDLEVGQARELHSRIDGWPIGARLACVALRGRADPAPFLQRFAHVDQPAADFLVGEVLTGLPAADRELLARVHPLVAPYLRGEHRSTRERGGEHNRLAAHPRAAPDDPLRAIRHAVLADDADLIVELVHRFAGLLLVTGSHPMLGWALSRIDERAVAKDPVLTLCAALVRIEAGLVNAATEDLAAAPAAVDVARSRCDSPEWTALALVGAGGRAMLVDADMAVAAAAFAEALELATVNGFTYLRMQCLALLAGVAGIGGDYSEMATAAAGADEVATSGGWELSPLATAARWMLAYSALLRSEPVEAYRSAVTLGRSKAAHGVVVWLAERIGVRGEVLLMQAWAEQAAGRSQAAKDLVKPVLDGTVTTILPDTMVEALLIEASAGVIHGIERELLVRLPSALSIDQIARELRIPPTEASTRIRAIYRKLGVSSRRSAVSVAHEQGLLH